MQFNESFIKIFSLQGNRRRGWNLKQLFEREGERVKCENSVRCILGHSAMSAPGEDIFKQTSTVFLVKIELLVR